MSDKSAPPQPGDAERRQEQLADLLRRRADVYSPKRERNPYYGDDDIDLLRSMLDDAQSALAESRAEVARLREEYVREAASRINADMARLRSPTATGEDRPLGYTMHDMDIAEALFTRGERTAISYSDRGDIAKAITAARAQAHRAGVREGIEKAARCPLLPIALAAGLLAGVALVMWRF